MIQLSCPHCGSLVDETHLALREHAQVCPRTLVLPYLNADLRQRLRQELDGDLPIGDEPITYSERVIIEGEAIRVETREERLLP